MLASMRARGHSGRIVLFSMVGAVNTGVDFVAYSACIFLGVAPALANIIAFSLTNPFSYFTNSRVTFGGAAGSAGLSVGGYAKFCAAHLLSLTISTALVFFLAGILGPFIAKFCAVLVTVFINYFASALLVFRSGEDPSAKNAESP